jgi:hypothetical protein
VSIDAVLARRITELIRALQPAPAPLDWPYELARRFDALPVYSDMGGALLLRPDGEVLSVLWDSESEARPAERRWRLLGLAAAAEQFPELTPLLPSRPATALSCPACRGTGRWRRAGVEPGPWCGECMGLGWLDADPGRPGVTEARDGV